MLLIRALAALVAGAAPMLPTIDTPSATTGADQPPRATVSASWVWPLQPRPRVVARFDPPSTTWGSGHRGVDLAEAGAGPNAAGAVVRAPQRGVVSFAGPVAGRPVLVIAHPGGLRSTFEPVTARVRVGDLVTAGEPVGELVTTGAGHCGALSCLHWGVLRDASYLDPLALLAGRVILLPIPKQM
jgi:murein DD-endopeptidase MepM/ murein hydrolase activator NlpD